MTSLPHPIGQKVVCVRADFSRTVFEWFDRVPVADGVYTISEIFWANEYGTGNRVLSVRLTELPPILPAWGGFSLWRFRLLADEKIRRNRARRKASEPASCPFNQMPR